MRKQLTETDLGRAAEVLDAMSSRRGPVTVDADSAGKIIGRAMGLVVTGFNMQRESNDDWRALGLHLARVGRDTLHLLRVPEADIKTLLTAFAEDITDLERKL